MESPVLENQKIDLGKAARQALASLDPRAALPDRALENAALRAGRQDY